MIWLRNQDHPTARALELLILTAFKTSEVLKATINEFDIDGALWTIPADRMKNGREHLAPLFPRAVELVCEAMKDRTSDLVHPGANARN